MKIKNYRHAGVLAKICIITLFWAGKAYSYECNPEYLENAKKGIPYGYQKHKSKTYCIGRLNEEATSGADELRMVGFTLGPTVLLNQEFITLQLHSIESLPAEFSNQHFGLTASTKDDSFFRFDSQLTFGDSRNILMDSYIRNKDYEIKSDNLVFLATGDLQGQKIYTPVLQRYFQKKNYGKYFAHFRLPNREVESFEYKVNYPDTGKRQDWRAFSVGGGFPNSIISGRLLFEDTGLAFLTVKMNFASPQNTTYESRFILLL